MKTIARALQGQEDTSTPRWINLRQVGRIFNTTGPAIGKQLDRVGLRESRRPSARAVRLGIGRVLPSSAHLATPVVQWHASKVAAALIESGLTPAQPFEVFCRAAVDKVSSTIRSFRENELPGGPPDTWWITHQMQEHLTRVPDNRRDDFIDELVAQLQRRGKLVKMDTVNMMIEALGELDGYQTRKIARELQASAPAVQSTRSTHRL